MEKAKKGGNVRVGEALTKSTKSRAACGGAMMRAVVENGDDAVLVINLKGDARDWMDVRDRLAAEERIMQGNGMKERKRGREEEIVRVRRSCSVLVEQGR
jgi:hypothetical protein